MKKYAPWLVIVLILLLVGAWWYFGSGTGQVQEQSATTGDAITAALAVKYNRSSDTVDVEVLEDTGSFARGSVRFTDEHGGGMWFAARTENGWEIAFDGNGIVPCDTADNYALPAQMVPQCIDTANNNELIQR